MNTMQQFTVNLHGLKRLSTTNLNMEHRITCTEKDILMDGDKEVSEEDRSLSSFTESKSLICPICKKEFSFRGSLELHIATHTKYKCEICDKGFPTKWQLQNHSVSHKDISHHQLLAKELFVCHVCNKRFSNKSSFTCHLHIHANEKPHTVTTYHSVVCSEGFSLEPSLNCHLKSETKEKHYICETCDEEIFEKSHSNEHHVCTRSKSFICEICKEKFLGRKSLAIHYKTHEDIKPHICEFCNKLFQTNGTFRRHLQCHIKKKSVCLWDKK